VTGRSRFLREIVPFASLAVAGLVLSTVAVARPRRRPGGARPRGPTRP
jgi:hypothetical protein